MFTRGLIGRTYGLDGDYTDSAVMWPGVPGDFTYGGAQPLTLPAEGAGGRWSMDPSNPKTWQQPVRWT
jgi:hypothetical protein